MHALLTDEIKKLENTVNDGDVADSMLALSYKFLDQYYLQIRKQEQKGFAITLIMAVLGFITTIGAVCGLLFFNLGISGYITAGTGLIIDFISSIFFHIYSRSSREMKDYFYRLLLSQNLAVSLVLVKSLPEEQRTAEVSKIIDTLISDYNKYLLSEPDAKTNDTKTV